MVADLLAELLAPFARPFASSMRRAVLPAHHSTPNAWSWNMPPPDPRRERLRLDGFELLQFPDGRCKAQVRTEWIGGHVYMGEAEGSRTPEGELRASARATLLAAQAATRGQLEFQLRGVKALRVFDEWMVVVSVRTDWEDLPTRLLGVCPCGDDDTARGAVMAVLDATNRILQRYLEPRLPL
jgi:hypothetical protein